MRYRLIQGLCIMNNGLAGQSRCPRVLPRSRPAAKCVASFITKESCEIGGGSWKKVTTHFKEKLLDISDSACANKFQTVRGVAYEPHLITQGTEGNEEDLVVADPPEVIYAPSTVVNHNGMNMEGKFSSYTWKIPYFPSNTIQRCVLRIR